MSLVSSVRGEILVFLHGSTTEIEHTLQAMQERGYTFGHIDPDRRPVVAIVTYENTTHFQTMMKELRELTDEGS